MRYPTLEGIKLVEQYCETYFFNPAKSLGFFMLG